MFWVISVYFNIRNTFPKSGTFLLGHSVYKLRIYGPICEEATWIFRHKEELCCLYDETDLVTTIKMTRLRWAGHIVRMQDNMPCKKITLDKPEGRRRAGRPKPQMGGRSDERWREVGNQELED